MSRLLRAAFVTTMLLLGQLAFGIGGALIAYVLAVTLLFAQGWL